MFKLIHKEEQAGGIIVLNEVLAPLIAAKAEPGQFVIVKASETGERIPLTVADKDPEKGTITLVYGVAGRSTKLFRELMVGDRYAEIIGPLGKATHLKHYGSVVCIGGGTGVAVLHPIARGLKEKGNHVTSILGARSEDFLVFRERMEKISDTLTVCTDDGSCGKKGFVTESLEKLLQKTRPGLVVAIGPVPMMKAVSEITRPFGIETVVSLNPIMIDGTGMCGCCRVSVGQKTRFACVEGPEFDGHQVDFDELMVRLDSYRNQ
jgi:ferredoxin--NADP+ reductase